jgi:hypothetical protein
MRGDLRNEFRPRVCGRNLVPPVLKSPTGLVHSEDGKRPSDARLEFWTAGSLVKNHRDAI